MLVASRDGRYACRHIRRERYDCGDHRVMRNGVGPRESVFPLRDQSDGHPRGDLVEPEVLEPCLPQTRRYMASINIIKSLDWPHYGLARIMKPGSCKARIETAPVSKELWVHSWKFSILP